MNNNIMMTIQNMMRMGKNPQAIVESLIQQNPQFAQLVNQIRNSGLTPQQYLEQYGRQNGMTNEVNQIKNMLGISH